MCSIRESELLAAVQTYNIEEENSKNHWPHVSFLSSHNLSEKLPLSLACLKFVKNQTWPALFGETSCLTACLKRLIPPEQ